MSAKAFSPPPRLNDYMSRNLIIFSSRIKVYVLKRERPETDDFAITKYWVVKEKYLVNIVIFQEIRRLFLTSVSSHPYKKI